MSDLFYFKPKLGFPEWDNSLAVDWLLKNEGKACWAELGRETGVRSGTQNNALHLGLDFIAKELNAKGLDVRKVMKPEIKIPWTVESCKDLLFRPIMKSMFSKKSTKDLAKVGEIEEVWEVLMRHLGEKFEIEWIPFPNKQHEKIIN